jgi:hypothetical protein
MSDVAKQIRTEWVTEISKELDETRRALETAEVEHAAAVSAALESSAVHREFEAALSPITEAQAGLPIESLAGPLAIRLHDLRAKAKAADSHKSRAHIDRQQLAARISELELALSQIDRVINPAEIDES